MKVRTVFFGWVGMVTTLAAACGGKAVIDPPLGAGGAGGTSSTTVTVGASTGTGQTKDCQALEAAYQTALSAAKVCNPGEENPCTKMVLDSLTNCCPSQTMVDASATDIDATFAALREQYAAAGCELLCEGCPPELPISGACDANTKGCVDIQNLPD